MQYNTKRPAFGGGYAARFGQSLANNEMAVSCKNRRAHEAHVGLNKLRFNIIG